MYILNEPQQALLKDERKLLNDLQLALVAYGADSEDQEALSRSIQQLDELFLLVVVGEFNAGKSAFINALLGHRVLQEGVTPTTTQIHILHHGEGRERTVVDEHQQVLTYPAEMLAEISIVDTPGTNAVVREHEVITSQFVPRSDIVLFITSADRPFTESERVFLERIRDWGKKVVIVINKIDILHGEEDLATVRDYVAENAHSLLGMAPEVYAVSARHALRAKQGEPALWEGSGFGPLEAYIHDTLDERGRIRLKLLNPLGVGTHVAEKYLSRVDAHLELLQDDLDVLANVETQQEMYREDMVRDFGFRLADVENLLLEMEQRGQEFFDDTFRLARVLDLLNRERLQRTFARQVVSDVPQHVEERVNALIDWLVDADLRQWQAVTDYLSERRREHQARIVGDPGAAGYHYDRGRLIDAVGREARHVIETYDETREAQAIAQSAQVAVAASAAIEVGAVGLGALITVLATTMAVDVTGVLLASLMAALGLFVIPTRRRRAKSEMHAKVAALRTQLTRSLDAQFGKEIERSLQRIKEAIAPYTRFVRSEHNKMAGTRAQLQQIRGELQRLRADCLDAT
jgi:small GTP-binding protein